MYHISVCRYFYIHYLPKRRIRPFRRLYSFIPRRRTNVTLSHNHKLIRGCTTANKRSLFGRVPFLFLFNVFYDNRFAFCLYRWPISCRYTSTLHLRLLLPWHVPISTHTWCECRSEDPRGTGEVEVKLLAIKERLVRAKCIHQFLAHKERSSRWCLICDLQYIPFNCTSFTAPPPRIYAIDIAPVGNSFTIIIIINRTG